MEVIAKDATTTATKYMKEPVEIDMDVLVDDTTLPPDPSHPPKLR